MADLDIGFDQGGGDGGDKTFIKDMKAEPKSEIWKWFRSVVILALAFLLLAIMAKVYQDNKMLAGDMVELKRQVAEQEEQNKLRADENAALTLTLSEQDAIIQDKQALIASSAVEIQSLKKLSIVAVQTDSSVFAKLRFIISRIAMVMTRADLSKIPVADFHLSDGVDTDHDGLSDVLESSFGTNPKDPDTDNDGYLDGTEVANGYNPLGPGKISFDQIFTDRYLGAFIAEATEGHVLWYVDPDKKLRYYVGAEANAYQWLLELKH